MKEFTSSKYDSNENCAHMQTSSLNLGLYSMFNLLYFLPDFKQWTAIKYTQTRRKIPTPRQHSAVETGTAQATANPNR